MVRLILYLLSFVLILYFGHISCYFLLTNKLVNYICIFKGIMRLRDITYDHDLYFQWDNKQRRLHRMAYLFSDIIQGFTIEDSHLSFHFSPFYFLSFSFIHILFFFSIFCPLVFSFLFLLFKLQNCFVLDVTAQECFLNLKRKRRYLSTVIPRFNSTKINLSKFTLSDDSIN